MTHEDSRGVFVPFWMLRECPTPSAAVLLAQITWLFQPSLRGEDRARFTERKGERWLALSDHEMAEFVAASEDAVYRSRSALRRAGMLVTMTSKVDGVKRALVRPDHEVLARRCLETAETRDSQTAETRDSPNRASAGSNSLRDGCREGGEGTPLSPDGDGALTPERGFDLFWQRYPRRNGKREGRGKALAQWAKLDLDTRKAAFRAAEHYAAACDAGATIAADAFRWLRDKRWEDWQTPAELARSNGRRVLDPAADLGRLEFDATGAMR